MNRKSKGDLAELAVATDLIARGRRGLHRNPLPSHSLTNGKVRATKHYTAETVEWIAVYDHTVDRCFYVPASELGAGEDYAAI